MSNGLATEQRWFSVSRIDAADESNTARAAKAAREFACHTLRIQRPVLAWLEPAHSDEFAVWARAISTEHGNRPLALKGASDTKGCVLPDHDTVCIRAGLSPEDTAGVTLKYTMRLHSIQTQTPEMQFRNIHKLSAALVQLDTDVAKAVQRTLQVRWQMIAEHEGIEAV